MEIPRRAFGVPEGAPKTVEETVVAGLGALSAGAMSATARAAVIMKAATEDMLGRYEGPKAFGEEWKWTRLLVPLQVRLFVEQVLWDKRGGYRDLVTGFAPVKTRGKKKTNAPGGIEYERARRRGG